MSPCLLVVSNELLNKIEQTFVGSRLDSNERARLVTAMLEDAFQIVATSALRAKAEEKLVHGISPQHIKQAAAILGGLDHE